MRVYGDNLIIAVDAGYGNFKTATCSFPTGIIKYDAKPYFRENLLTYNNSFYIIGSGHKEFTDRKIIDEDYYLMTLAAIARELSTQRLTGGKILLAVGLPLTWLSSQRTEYRNYLLRNKTVDFNFRGTDYHIEIADVMVFPQGYAAIAEHLGEYRDVNIIADIGNGTVNLLRVVDRKVDVRSMTTEACGVKDCVVSMRMALANEHSGARVDDYIMERIVRNGTARIDDGYLKTLTRAAERYTDDLFRRFREYGYNEKTMRLFVLGGGSCLVKNFSSFDPDRVIVNTDIHANARGYEWLAYERLRKGGTK